MTNTNQIPQQVLVQYLSGLFQTKDIKQIEQVLTDMGEDREPFLQEVQKAIIDKKPVEVFIKEYSEKRVQMAKRGAKIDYLKRLSGECPEGFNAVKMLKGGTVCIKCGGKVKKEKMKKSQGGLLERIQKLKK